MNTIHYKNLKECIHDGNKYKTLNFKIKLLATIPNFSSKKK